MPDILTFNPFKSFKEFISSLNHPNICNPAFPDGKAIKLKMSQIDEVIIQANNQLGGFWRLPTREELENLVCMSCDKVKINDKFFPNTPYEPFWTGEKNNWSKTKGFYWSVNFFTGHTFGRFPGHIPNFVRLVSER